MRAVKGELAARTCLDTDGGHAAQVPIRLGLERLAQGADHHPHRGRQAIALQPAVAKFFYAMLVTLIVIFAALAAGRTAERRSSKRSETRACWVSGARRSSVCAPSDLSRKGGAGGLALSRAYREG